MEAASAALKRQDGASILSYSSVFPFKYFSINRPVETHFLFFLDFCAIPLGDAVDCRLDFSLFFRVQFISSSFVYFLFALEIFLTLSFANWP